MNYAVKYTLNPVPKLSLVKSKSPLSLLAEGLKSRHVLWAVDEAQRKSESSSLDDVLKKLNYDGFVVIEPVHVLSADNSPVPTRLFFKWIEELAHEAENRLQLDHRASKLSGIMPLQVLKKERNTNLSPVEILAQYASSKDVDLIVAKARRRNALVRFLRPGFTDELVKISPVPVLVVEEGLTRGSRSIRLHLPVAV